MNFKTVSEKPLKNRDGLLTGNEGGNWGGWQKRRPATLRKHTLRNSATNGENEPGEA